MIAALNQLATVAQGWLTAGGMVFLRVGAAISLLPVFGDPLVPTRVRLALALAFTAVVTPAVLPQLPPPGVLALASETVIGLSLGLGVRLLVMGMQMAGTIIAQAVSLSQAFGGAAAEPQPAIAQTLMIAALALAVAADLHVRVAGLLILSYHFLPAGHFPIPPICRAGGSSMSRRISRWPSRSPRHSSGAALVFNVAIGVINRAMPQLMVTFIGAPALTFGGLALLAVVAPVALTLLEQQPDRLLRHALVGPPMSGEVDGEKEHEASQKRLDDARARGEVPRSTDLTVAAGYGGLLLAFTAGRRCLAEPHRRPVTAIDRPARALCRSGGSRRSEG